MMYLNLLPRQSKREIQKKTKYVAMVNNAILLTIVFVIISIFAVASQKFVSYQAKIVASENGTSTKYTRIGELNNQMAQVEVAQKDFVKWSRILSNFLSLVPTDNTVKQLTLNRENNHMIMSGFSTTRDAFLKLKANLENSDILTEVESPISNLLHREDIDFVIEAKLNL